MARRTINRRRKGDSIAAAQTSKRACAYIRVSTEEQAIEGVSLAAQEDRVRAYATAQGLDLGDIFRDEGVSAGETLETRPAGGRLAAAVQAGEYAHVVALKLDRCFRNAIDCMQTIEAWTKSGIAVHFIDLGGQAVDTRTAMGKFFLTIMASCAELELNTIRDRTRAALQHKRRQGDRLGTTPLGFRTPAPGAALVPDNGELRTVRRLLELCVEDAPFSHVARRLDAEGHRTKRGGRWHAATVRLVWLARARYVGLLGHDAEHLTTEDGPTPLGS